MRTSDAESAGPRASVGSMGTRRRVALTAVASVAVAAALAATATLVPWRQPPRTSGLVPVVADDALLRERLGGLAGLVVGDDPRQQACADPGPVPAVPDPGGVEGVIGSVEAIRGLALADRPEIQLLGDAEMTAQVAEAFGDQWNERRLDLDTRTLTALGAIAPGTDLARLRVDRFASQVSGFHLGDRARIGIRTGDPAALSPLERVVLAHELEHALSYTHLGRPVGAQTEDAVRAYGAVVEGSATATMLQYATAALTPADQLALRDQLRSRADQRRLAGYSPYLRAELQFPYLVGLRYTCQRWLAGGWDAVAEAYRDPPASTAAVLFPQRHDERPRQPARLGDPGGEWDRVRIASFGAAELEWLLMAPGGNPNAALDGTRQRVAAWDGGELTVWTDGTETAVGLSLVDRGEGPPLCGTVRAWYAAAFPMALVVDSSTGRSTFTAGRQDAVLACQGDQVRLAIAPTIFDSAAITG
jgi:hypothetical protein